MSPFSPALHMIAVAGAGAVECFKATMKT